MLPCNMKVCYFVAMVVTPNDLLLSQLCYRLGYSVYLADSAAAAVSTLSLTHKVASASNDSKTAAANAASLLYSLYALSTNNVSVCVLPMILPDMTDTAPNSPMARALVRITPYRSPHRMLGRVTSQNTCNQV